MINIVAICFTCAALVGSIMAFRHFRKQSIPWPLPAIHGVFVITGLVLMAIYLFTAEGATFKEGMTFAWIPFGLFVGAAFGGGLILKVYLRSKPLPSAMIIIHAMVALMGLLFLLAFLYARNVVHEPQEVKEEFYEAVLNAR